ncbi:MAG TPA: hypothetical protein VGR53_02090 [Nitrososphaerales archaeon]|nr:hypothetical protein [Nitrososphaerales archaeon]
MRRCKGILACLLIVSLALIAIPRISNAQVTGGGLDCNGYSLTSPNVRSLLCADPMGFGGSRFYDNGYYIGHDEPSIQFVSNAPGSANNFEWQMKLPGTDPTPTQSGTQVANSELFATFWFSLALCDPNSGFGGGACTANSDSNTASSGSAILELQFYPPISSCTPSSNCLVNCSAVSTTQWCAAMNIDSLECNSVGVCNPSCTEPVNFAFIQRNGVPPGPPGPGNQNSATFTPNSQTLLMSLGDNILVKINDTSSGLVTKVTDTTTGQSGYVVASSGNGFQHTTETNCSTSSFSFHPEYSTASPSNIVPWAALTANVNIAYEIGHWELTESPTDGDDTSCVTMTGVTGCTATDSDFDGSPYKTDWPSGSSSFPSSLVISSVTGNGIGPMSFDSTTTSFDDGYGFMQFETSVGGSESGCNTSTGTGCVVPPPGAAFYPFYTEASSGPSCTFNFGNVIGGQTTNSFGKDKEYGSPSSRYGGTIASGDISNSCTPHPSLTGLTGSDQSLCTIGASCTGANAKYDIDGDATALYGIGTVDTASYAYQEIKLHPSGFTVTGMAANDQYELDFASCLTTSSCSIDVALVFLASGSQSGTLATYYRSATGAPVDWNAGETLTLSTIDGGVSYFPGSNNIGVSFVDSAANSSSYGYVTFIIGKSYLKTIGGEGSVISAVDALTYASGTGCPGDGTKVGGFCPVLSVLGTPNDQDPATLPSSINWTLANGAIPEFPLGIILVAVASSLIYLMARKTIRAHDRSPTEAPFGV